MTPQFSDLGNRFGGPSGIQELMEDLGQAMASDPEMRMLGGGNPAAIPEVQALWRQRLNDLCTDPTRLDRALLNYDPPGGHPEFRERFANFLQRNLGWKCEAKNVVVMPGGQAAFFYLFNLLGGTKSGQRKRILFPIVPEYIGYVNQSIEPHSHLAFRPIIEERADHSFKYRIDFDRLKITPDVAAICLSCPTNPTGNVVSTDDLNRLRDLARTHGIPLLLDQAYGMPFPGAIYVDWAPVWDEDMVVSISLSKLGLPGVRTSVIVAHEKIADALANMNAVAALANGNLGQVLLNPLLEGDRLIRLSKDVIRPFYEERCSAATDILHQEMGDAVDYALHAGEGAFFLWLWLKSLPITTAELYQRLKRRKVLVVPGHHFFFGLDEPWQHQNECLRITYSQPKQVVHEAMRILADEVRSACGSA